MTASVTIRVDDEAAQAEVPLAAITESDGRPVVFVVDRVNQIVRKTPITIGGIAEEGMKIVQGLRAGDMVVTAGVQFLRDGMRVRLPGER